MKVAGQMLALIVAMGLATGGVQAQVAAEKTPTSNVDYLVEQLYLDLELRHKTNVFMDDDKIEKTTPLLQIRPNIGIKLYDDRLNAYVTPIFEKTTETQAVTEGRGEFWVEYTTFKDNTLGTLNPIFWGYLPFEDKGTNMYLGTYGKLNAPEFTTPIGNLYARYELEYAIGQTSRDKTTTLRNQSGLANDAAALRSDVEAEEDALKVKQRDLDGYTFDQVRVGIKPTDKLDINFRSGYYRSFTPDYVLKSDATGDGSLELDGYNVASEILNRYVVTYAFTDKLTVSNELRQTINGFYEAGTNEDKLRWENRLKVIATLF